MSASGTHARHASGLEARFSAEVAHAVSGMSREEGNEIVVRLLKIYEPKIQEKDVGRPFDEVYDPVSVKPTIEWEDIYREVKDELFKLGIPFDKVA
jgi:methylamine--corrinoid protein Co-methyltransferase